MKKFIFEDEAEDIDILAEDDLDLVEDDEEVEQVNEVRYIDPANLDNYDPNEIEEVTTASGEKRYRRKKAGGQSAQITQVDKKDGEQKEKEPKAKVNVVDLPKKIEGTSQLNAILRNDLGIQDKLLTKEAKLTKLTEQDASKVKELLDNGNSIKISFDFWDDSGYLIDAVSVYQKGEDGKVYRSTYQNYSGTWHRDKEEDAEYTSDNTDEFIDVLSDLADDSAKFTSLKLMY